MHENTDTTTTTAPDHEALLSTVETVGAALVAALEACVAAGLTSAETVASAARIASTVGMRDAWAERERPKGPLATVTRSDGGTYHAEVDKITDARIILRNGHQFSRVDGYRTGAPTGTRLVSKWRRPRIAMDEIARIVATGWKAPKAAKKVSAK